MDGNGRWASDRNLPRLAGHRAGVVSVRTMVEECARRGVGSLTLFAFSRENWQRPGDEVSGLMELLDRYLKRELANLNKNNVRLKTIGRTDDLPRPVLKTLQEVVIDTEKNDGLTLILALSYSGRQDIADAAGKIASEAASGRLKPEDVDENLFESYLATSGIPDPDLLIRTSGEMRMSNFLLWQTAYTEFYVTEKLWPDFTVQDLNDAIDEYGRRERRFGLTSEQMKAGRK